MMEYDEFSAMNTTLLVAAEGDRDALQPGFTLVRQFVEESEQRFSRFRGTSELSRLNRSRNRWFEASPEMFDVLQEAMTLHHLTGGLFDPSILGALEQAGYGRSMDEIRQLERVPEARHSSPWVRPQFVETLFDPERRAIRLPAGLHIDLGGIAKGWIAAQAARRFAPFTGACVVSAGGDMALTGLPRGQSTWEVALEDPCDINRDIAVLDVAPGALATSSITRRRWLQGNEPRHHIIDPRTGLPSETVWLSVTVTAKKATYAEAFAKALLIAGPQEALALASRVHGLRFLAVERDGGLWGTIKSKEMYNVSEIIQSTSLNR